MSNESATDTLRNWGTKSIGQGFLDVKKGKMKIEIGEGVEYSKPRGEGESLKHF